MGKKKTSDLESVAGVFQGLITNIMTVVREDGVPFDVIRKLSGDDGRDTLRRVLTMATAEFQQFAKDSQEEYFTPLADADVPAEHQALLAKYRKLAEEHGVPATIPLCYRVRAGFTLKHHAPKAGPCYKDFQNQKDWNFIDRPTQNGLIFWVPRLVKGSTSKSVDEQRQLFSDLRQRLELTEHHLANFGEVSLVAGLILAHFKATGERVPLNQQWARTDTSNADGCRLDLGYFGVYGLCFDSWRWGDERDDYLGVFALGVELGS